MVLQGSRVFCAATGLHSFLFFLVLPQSCVLLWCWLHPCILHFFLVCVKRKSSEYHS